MTLPALGVAPAPLGTTLTLGCCRAELRDRKPGEQHPPCPASQHRGAAQDEGLRCSLRQIRSTDELPHPHL